MHEWSIATETTIGLCLFLDLQSPLFYQQCKARDVENSKLIGHPVTVQVQSSLQLYADVNDPFPFNIFLSPFRRLC